MADIYMTMSTNVGSAKIAAAVAAGVPMIITQAAVGDGNGSCYSPTPLQTELRNEKWRGDIVTSEVDPDELSMFNVRFIVPADVGGFFVREAALFDKDGDMIFICNLPDTKKEVYTSGSVGKLTVIMHIAVTNTDALRFDINPDLDNVTPEQLTTVIDGAIHSHDTDVDAHGGILETVATEETAQSAKIAAEAAKAASENNKNLIGTNGDTANSGGTTLFSLIKYIVSMFTGAWTDARANKIDVLDNIGASNDDGGNSTAGTAMAKLNKLLTDWTATRAGYVDYLANGTYGLSALNSKITGITSGKVPVVKSVQTGSASATKTGTTVINISEVNPQKSFVIAAGFSATYNSNMATISAISSVGAGRINTEGTSFSINGRGSSSTGSVSFEWQVIEFY